MSVLTESEFYDALAEFFDVMTNWKSRLDAELPWLTTLLADHQVESILDSAAGTGQHAIALAQRGFRVTGADASIGMVQRARENAAQTQTPVDFRALRFSELADHEKDTFDAILCLGNSFPHVLDPAAALASLKSMRLCLRPGGILVMQNLNYDKRWKDKPRWFGVNSGLLHGKETLVWRFADYGETLITFNIALFVRQASGWTVQVQTTLQNPYQARDLAVMGRSAGFASIQFFGGMDGSAFEDKLSPDLVLVATA